jgi:hypothetical protein
MSANIEHHTPDEMTVTVKTLDCGEVDMFKAAERLEDLVGQVVEGVYELAFALDDARGATATAGNLPPGK